MELKVGDRVRYVVQRGIDNVKVGEVGIIRGISPSGSYAVDFEESGYRHNCDGLCQSNHGWWCSGDTLEPVDSKTLRMADGTIIGDFSTGGTLPKGVSIHDLPTNELIVPWNMIPNIHIETDMSMAELSQKLSEHFNTLPKQRMCGKRAENIYFDENVFKEEKNLKFTFYFNVNEGTRVDKSCNGTIPTMITNIELLGGNVSDKVISIEGSATCDKADYDMRQGVLEALANAVFDGNFEKAYSKAAKANALCERQDRTCYYCGKVFDTVEEKQKHEAWHVERKKARRERYLLRKRAKEIAFEEQAQKLAKEMIKEDK